MMKTNIIPAAISILGIIAGYILGHPLSFHTCTNTYKFNGYIGCLDECIKTIGTPLFLFALWTLPVSLILILVPRSIYHSWLKLAAWALPLAFLNIASTPVWPMTQGLGMFPGGPDRTEITATDGRFFLVLSLLVIVLAFVRERLIATGKRSLVEVEDIVKELWALVGTIAGLIFAALSFKDSLIPSSATIDAALSHFFGSIVFGILALGYASFLAYRKVHTRAHLGWKLMLTFLLSGATIIVFTLSVIMGV